MVGTGSTRFVGRTFQFDYDNIGNRTERREGGDSVANSASLFATKYSTSNGTTNLVNQYTNIANPNAFYITGASAYSPVNITVDGAGGAATKVGSYFYRLFSGQIQPDVKNVEVKEYNGATLISTQTGEFYLGGNPQAVAYDGDGNLTSDGRWTYVWDAENRLKSMSASGIILNFKYDYLGRRIQKQIVTGTTVTQKFVYDGWNCVARFGTTGSQAYVWGPDVSGSWQGAGGVGGLLFIHELNNSTYAVTNTHYCGVSINSR